MQQFQECCIADESDDDIENAANLMRDIMRGELDGTRTTITERMRAAAYLVHWHQIGAIWVPPNENGEIDALSAAVDAFYNEKSAATADGDSCTGFD